VVAPPESAEPAAPASNQLDALANSNPLNDRVRILAGLPVDPRSEEAEHMESSAWQEYQRQIEQTWTRYNQQQHAKVEAFRDQWLPAEVHRGRDLLYPFAGADFLYADLFFPDASNIYMFGLEPLGEIPGREQLNRAYYQGVVRATEDLLRLTFFRTKAMREDFRDNGTVPLLCYFIVHRGHSIRDITYLRLDDTGIPYQSAPAEATGARIAFLDAKQARMRYLWYWRGDLSNHAFASTPGFKRYIAELPPANLYMKAASYLCHHQGFADACTLFRDRAELSLQEDSGMPLRFFPEQDWSQRFFGQYRDPIAIFTDRLYRQNNALKQAFATAEQVHELTFPLGYHASARADNLMLALRRQQPEAPAPTPPQETPLLAEDPETAAAAAAQQIAVATTTAIEPTPEPHSGLDSGLDSKPNSEQATKKASATETETETAAAGTPDEQPVPSTTSAQASAAPTEARTAAAQPAPKSEPESGPESGPASKSEPGPELVPESTPASARSQPRDIQAQLKAAGMAYKTNENGVIWLIQSVDTTRTQLTFIAPEPKPVAGQPMRDIWSIGYLSTEDSLPADTLVQLLKDNAATNLGAWEFGEFLGKAAGIFRARVPADADWQSLTTAMRTVATIADRKERELMGNDEL
jgi:hypothetical protein